MNRLLGYVLLTVCGLVLVASCITRKEETRRRSGLWNAVYLANMQEVQDLVDQLEIGSLDDRPMMLQIAISPRLLAENDVALQDDLAERFEGLGYESLAWYRLPLYSPGAWEVLGIAIREAEEIIEVLQVDVAASVSWVLARAGIPHDWGYTGKTYFVVVPTSLRKRAMEVLEADPELAWCRDRLRAVGGGV